MNRKSFLQTSLAGLAGWSIFPNPAFARKTSEPDPLRPDLVREFVGAAHRDLGKVQTLLAETPNLIFSRWDWGNGDFEEAVEAAGHVGDKEIVRFLIEQGARVNLFVLAMLGEYELVVPVLEKYPMLLRAKGAHGFTLLHHAKRGGEAAQKIHDYLLDKGLTETRFKLM